MSTEKRDYEAPGFGFSVTVLDAPVRTVRGMQFLDLPPRALRAAVMRELVLCRARWSGDHVAYVRAELGLTLQGLAELVGLGHSSVVAWEKKRADRAGMRECAEFSLRMLVVERLRDQVPFARALADVSSETVRDALNSGRDAVASGFDVRAARVREIAGDAAVEASVAEKARGALIVILGTWERTLRAEMESRARFSAGSWASASPHVKPGAARLDVSPFFYVSECGGGSTAVPSEKRPRPSEIVPHTMSNWAWQSYANTPSYGRPN